MTVKEYLKIHTKESLDSVGIYKANMPEAPAGAATADLPTDIIDAHATAASIAAYMDREIDHTHLWIYDDTITDIYGKEVPVKRIRACIYVR